MATRTEYKYDLLVDEDTRGVHDGDTFRGLVRIDLGFKKYYEERMNFRVNGIDTPEVTSQRKIVDITLRAKHKLAGIYVREFVKKRLLNQWVVVSTHKDPDKYGRVLTDVSITHNNCESNLGGLLIFLKYAKPYFGGTKPEWLESELDFILNSLGGK